MPRKSGRKKQRPNSRRRVTANRKLTRRFDGEPELGSTDSAFGSSAESDSRVFYLQEFEVTWEPVEQGHVQHLPPEVEARAQVIARDLLIHDDGAKHVPELERLVERYPNEPKFWNFLTGAVEAAGDRERVVELLREAFQRFPNYLFAVACYARYCLQERWVDEADRVLAGRYTPPAFYPDRRRFHITEVVALETVVAELAARQGHMESAYATLEMLEELAPDSPEVRQLEWVLMRETIRQGMKKLFRRGRKKKKADVAPGAASASPQLVDSRH